MRSGPHAISIGKPDASIVLTEDCSDTGQLAIDPMTLRDQSKARILAPISPPPCRTQALLTLPAEGDATVSRRGTETSIAGTTPIVADRTSDGSVPISASAGIGWAST